MYKVCKALLLSLIALFVLLALVLLGISFLPYESVKPSVDALAPDGRNDLFTADFFARIARRLWAAGGVLLIAGALLYALRERAARYLAKALANYSSSGAELASRFREAMRRESKTHIVALLIILAVAVAVRLPFLPQPMRNDESFTFLAYASPSLLVGLSHYSANNHLFHTFLVSTASALFGDAPWVLRLPALVAGILLVPAIYLLIRQVYDKNAALLAAGLVASSSILVEYSTNARGYSLICLIFLLILALAAYIVREGNNSAAWLLFTILSVLGFYTVPIMLYPYGIVALWVVLSVAFRRTEARGRSVIRGLLTSAVVTGAVTLALYVPVFVVSGVRAVAGNPFVAPRTWNYFLTEWPVLLAATWKQWNRDIPLIVAGLLVVGFVLSLILHRRMTKYRVPMALAVIAWVAPLVLVQRVAPDARIWLFLLPLYLGLAAAGISYLGLRLMELGGRGSWSLAPVALGVLLSIWLGVKVARSQAIGRTGEAEGLGNAEAVAVFLKGYLNERDRVLAATPAAGPLAYYWARHDVPNAYFWRESADDSHHRLIVVVNESEAETSDSGSGKQTVAGVLASNGLTRPNLSAPKLIKRFGPTSLYEIDGRNEASKLP